MKIFVALTIFLVAFQNTSAAPEGDLEALDIKEIVNTGLKIIIKALNNTIDVTEKLADDYSKNATAAVEEVNEHLIKFGDSIYNTAVSLINKLLTQLETEVNESAKKGIECLESQKSNINSIVEEGISSIVHCIGANVSLIISPAKVLIESGKATRDTLAIAQSKLELCTLGDICLVQLISDLKDLPADLIENIGKAVPLVKALITVLRYNVPPCVTADAQDIWKSIIQVIDDTMDCIVK